MFHVCEFTLHVDDHVGVKKVRGRHYHGSLLHASAEQYSQLGGAKRDEEAQEEAADEQSPVNDKDACNLRSLIDCLALASIVIDDVGADDGRHGHLIIDCIRLDAGSGGHREPICFGIEEE